MRGLFMAASIHSKAACAAMPAATRNCWPALPALMQCPRRHLRELLGDPKRSEQLFYEHNGILADLSRQRITDETLEVSLPLKWRFCSGQ